MKLTDRAETVAKLRIFAKDATGNCIEDFDGMCHRVAKHLANSEEEEKDLFWVMNNLLFLPNSPCLVNAGAKGRKNQLSACFVLSVEDSIEDIYDTIKETALIHKTGGGTGFNFSKIRPKDSNVASTGGVASGPVSFMKVFDASTDGIKQGGVRRGANMGVLRVDHPDILDFVNCKRGKNALQNFNISVAITDEFMEAKLKGNEFTLVNPKTKEKTSISAKTIWDAIVDNAWNSADPGVLFIDRINEHNPLTGVSSIIEATNPCVSGDTLVLTDNGYIRIDELVGKPVNIWNGYRFSKVTPQITGTNQKMVTVELSDGNKLTCTEYHKFIAWKGTVAAKDLQIGDKLIKWNYPVIEGNTTLPRSYAYTTGFFCGDGSQETTRDRNSIWLYGDKIALLDHLEYATYNECANDRLFVKMRPSVFDKQFVPDTNYSIQTRLDYLAGLIDSDGTLNDKGGSIALWSNDNTFITKVKYMLHTLGINCSVSIGTSGGSKSMPNGKGGHKEYNTQDCFRLVISAYNVMKLRELGLATNRVAVDAKPNRSSARAIYVKSVETSGIADVVYCFTEPFNHTGVFNGMMTGQCGEQPLAPGEACGLGSINLAEVIKDYGIDYDKLKKITRIGVLLLNRMMTKSEYPNKKIAERVNASRKIGLGVMGFADMLIKMRIPYTSQDAQEVAGNIAQCILDTCVKATHELGTKEGVFPLFKSEYKMPGHIKESLKRLKIKPSDYKPANSTLTTIAPTGTLSIIANCSSGIEPIFHFEQTERRVDMEIVHTHPLYAAYKEKFPKCDMPHYFQELADIDVDTHVYIQATFQKYICSGVSKTANLPHDATKQDVEKVYREAFILGCKGVTVYRDGCLENQVISGKDSKGFTIATEILPEPRPEALSGITYEIKTGFGPMLVTVNYKDGKPFEVICQLGKSGASEAAKAEAISRLCSILLRCNVPPKVIVEQLEGIVGSESIHTKYGLVTSIPDALSKIMINHVLTKEEYNPTIPTMIKCPDCGKFNTMIKEGSCSTCQNCGFKSCGG